MSNTFKCIIIDDEEVDRLTILSYARKYPFLDIAGIYSSAEEALLCDQIESVKILLCDILMPVKTGFYLRRELLNVPVCVFITAYSEFALESYDLAAFDFLIKPLNAERFELTMNRIKAYLEIRNDSIKLQSVLSQNTSGDCIFIKDGHDHIKINIADIVYLEALKDYTLLFTPEKKYYLLSSISSLLNQQKFQSFIRVHRSYAVQKQLIQKITYNNIMVKDIAIPVGRIYKDNLEIFKS